MSARPYPTTNHDAQDHPHRGFWDKVKKQTSEGWNKILPHNRPEMGREALADTLAALIAFLPVTVLWRGRELTASLDSGDTGGDLQSGGLLPTGTITLYLSKADFPTTYPEPHDEIQILTRGKWETFLILSVSEPFDQSDPALIITAERENV